MCETRWFVQQHFDEFEQVFLQSPECRLHQASIGTAFMDVMPGESEQDGEGKQTMRTLARNMTFLMKSIALGKEQFGLPEKEERIATHFIR